MFFIFGISNGEKKLNFVQTMVCTSCGQFGRLEVFMTYQYFSLFFIPIFRWGLHFYAKSTCCGTVYQLETPLGKRILKGEQVSLSEEDLTAVNSGWSQARQGFERYDNPQYGSQPQYGQDTAKTQHGSEPLKQPYESESAKQPYGSEPGNMHHEQEPEAGQMAKRCISCGYIAAPDFVFCPKCGKPL